MTTRGKLRPRHGQADTFNGFVGLEEIFLEVAVDLDVKVILTPPCIFH
jgi:hypothetical protein